MQIEKGSVVIYGSFGLCRVKDIAFMSFSNDIPKERYFILSPMSYPASTYYIPEKNAYKLIRPPLTAEQINTLIDEAKKLRTSWIDNRQLRSDNFRSILSKGVSAELISLLHCLYQKREDLKAMNKNLCSTDESVFSSAEKLIQEELAFSLKIDKSCVNEYISSLFAKED